MIRITAVICTYNRYDVLPKAIKSLKNQTLDRDLYRILVVDNSPDFEYATCVQTTYQFPPFIEYLIEETPGLSNARNVAAKRCGTEFIAYMDDDAIATPGWLENILAGFVRFGQEAAVLGGKVEPIWEDERPDWLDDSLLGFVSAVNWGGETRIANEGEWFAGTNIAFRTQEILDCGGFEVSLGRNGGGSVLLSNEELKLLDQLKAKGKLAIYVPEAEVSHLVEQRRVTCPWFRQRVAWQAISDYMMAPEIELEKARSQWDLVQNYFCQLPPRERTIRGLFYDTNNPQQFRDQLRAIPIFTTMLLSGFDGIEK
jgi:glucosyl-dolichyl phosphate glucuronosyltransferase